MQILMCLQLLNGTKIPFYMDQASLKAYRDGGFLLNSGLIIDLPALTEQDNTFF